MARKKIFQELIKLKNSIFTKILAPTIAVMLLQAALVSIVLFWGGTVQSLDNSSNESLFRNAENRTITLENMMVHTWGNIDTLETDIAVVISEYMAENALSADDIFGNPAHEKELLTLISETLIYTLRTASTTGSFMFFADENAVESDTATLTGLYYRDFNPLVTSSDYSDIQLAKGSAEIAKKHNISLTSLWSEKYVLNAGNVSTWEAVLAPYRAALDYPDLASRDLALWSAAHYLEPDLKIDSTACITYARPLFFEGRPVGVFGIEVQVEHMKRYFPSGDIGEMGGYMLLQYRDGETLNCAVNAVTGSYIKRLADFGATLTLEPKEGTRLYRAHSDNFEPVSVAVQPLKLYNSNAPFSDRQWGLAAMMPDSVLFVTSENMRNGILSSMVTSLVIGFILMMLSVRMTTRPLFSIASQLENGHADDPVVIKSSNAYELTLLCDTINEMKRKRQNIEIALREEGERYMLALESAVDVFIEYNIINDRLKIYSFAEQNQKQELTSDVVEDFKKNVGENGICHPAEIKEFVEILSGLRSDVCEIRLRTEVFPHVIGVPDDDGYYWFSFKAVQIRSDDEVLEKTIGSAKHITAEKLKEFAKIEASHRDLTTGAYNREYGNLLVAGRAGDALQNGENYCLLAIVIDDFEKFEVYYGRVFGAAMLKEISGHLLALQTLRGVIRWGNSEFIAFCDESEVENVVKQLGRSYDSVYTGENSEMTFAINMGIVKCGKNDEPEDNLSAALAAAHFCGKTGVNVLFAEKRDANAETGGALQSGSAAYAGVDISKEAIVSFAFNLFEHTNDFKSAVHMLLRVIGGLHSLERVILCEYDEDFGSNQVTYQWMPEGVAEYRGEMERTTHADFEELVTQLDENGILLYNSDSVQKCSLGVRRLLCVRENVEFAALCCAMYENGTHTGRMLFVSSDKMRRPTKADIFGLYEVTKIISTRFNLEKSDSASRAKSEFLSKMSHEIRTPMNAIIGLTRIAQESEGDPARIKNSLDKIELSANHLLSLINDVLDMSRIESGKLTIESKPFSLTAFLRGIDALMRPQFDEKKVAIAIAADISHDRIEGDEQKLRQVIINLLGNACKFTPNGGTVTLSVSQQLESDGSACKCSFSVKDNGVGISKKDQFNIFNAFEQARSSNSDAGNPQGTGLGLAISNNFVSAMGGRIELWSDRGQGSDFSFTLSFTLGQELPADGGEVAAPRMSAERFKGKRVLIVDDNDINLEIAVFLVEEVGFVSEVAKNGKEAVEAFHASEPGYFDIIFMDISMPIMDGFTATREIRKQAGRSDSRSIPIIAMTANAFSEDTKKSMEAGMNAHVAKPIDANLLYTTLDRLLFPGTSAEDAEGT